MAKHIPFVYTASDADLVSEVFSDAEIVRVSLKSAAGTTGRLPSSAAIWVDAGVDSLVQWKSVTDDWKTHFSQFEGSDELIDAEFWRRPNARKVEAFVNSVMRRCMAVVPDARWISVPQVPLGEDASAHKMNRSLAVATQKWRMANSFDGKFLLPIIIAHQNVTNKKTARNPKVALAKECMEKAGADGYWVVEAGLNDQDGARPLERTRFPGIIAFHEELREAIPRPVAVVGGPYWGLNLVLWARGIIDHPAIGVGSGFQYRPPGLPFRRGDTRLALPPLRRCAVASDELQDWLRNVPRHDEALSELLEILRDFGRYIADQRTSRAQIAQFYKKWFDLISSAEPSGRGLALYQDLSAAYVLGRGLPPLPDTERSARRPERVAQQLMMQCL